MAGTDANVIINRRTPRWSICRRIKLLCELRPVCNSKHVKKATVAKHAIRKENIIIYWREFGLTELELRMSALYRIRKYQSTKVTGGELKAESD